MKLYEEYFRRHNIKEPIVEHCSAGSLFLRTKNIGSLGSSWILLNITWVENTRGPGNYFISTLTPIRDGHEKLRMFNCINSTTLPWDKYEDYLFDWVNKFGNNEPISQNKSFFAAWEMFVYIFDSWFKNQPQTLKTLLFETLDEDNSFDKRKTYHKEICSYMSVHTPAILKIWKEEILYRTSSYAEWLVKLIEEKCQKNMLQSKLLTQ